MEEIIFWVIGVLLVVGVVVFLGAPANSPPPYKVVIEEILFWTDDEVVIIRNKDTKEINLSGWRLVTHHDDRASFTFPDGCILLPGAAIKIHSGPESSIHSKFLAKEEVCRPNGDLLWTLHHIWCDQNGDTAYLFDSEGRKIDEYKYGGGWHPDPDIPCNASGEE
jgi:hypothetical protein